MNLKKTIIKPYAHPLARENFVELWEYRELLIFLTQRQISVRYKQSVIGIGWAVIQPIVTMVVFTIIFGNLAQVETPNGLDYAVFTLAGLLPWRYFASAVTGASTSMVMNSHIIGKVYFPRLIMLLVSVLAPMVDFAIALVILLILMPIFGVGFSFKLLLIPILLILTAFVVLSVGLWLSAINVRFRDVGQAIPFAIQTLMYLSPVIYPASMVPEKFKFLYALNPMTTIIEIFRWITLGSELPEIGPALVSMLAVIGLFLTGLIFFNRVERTFVDVI